MEAKNYKTTNSIKNRNYLKISFDTSLWTVCTIPNVTKAHAAAIIRHEKQTDMLTVHIS